MVDVYHTSEFETALKLAVIKITFTVTVTEVAFCFQCDVLLLSNSGSLRQSVGNITVAFMK